MTFTERFLGLGNPIGGRYAPSILGAPSYTHQTDYQVFKKTDEEKAELKAIKMNHKAELNSVYGIGKVGKHLNIPSKELVIA